MDKMKTIRGIPIEPANPMSMLPSFSLTEKDLPAIKKWNVGGKYKIEVEVEMVGQNKDEYLHGTPLTSRFRINKVEDLSLSADEKMARRGR